MRTSRSSELINTIKLPEGEFLARDLNFPDYDPRVATTILRTLEERGLVKRVRMGPGKVWIWKTDTPKIKRVMYIRDGDLYMEATATVPPSKVNDVLNKLFFELQSKGCGISFAGQSKNGVIRVAGHRYASGTTVIQDMLALGYKWGEINH